MACGAEVVLSIVENCVCSYYCVATAAAECEVGYGRVSMHSGVNFAMSLL